MNYNPEKGKENQQLSRLENASEQIEEIVSVSEAARVVLGGTPRTDVPEYWNGDIKWATAKDVVNSKSRYLRSTERRITQDGIDNSAAKILPRDTIIITARGTVGQLALLFEPMAFNQTCYGLMPKEKILPLFLYYRLKSMLIHIDSVSYGTVFRTITMGTFKDMRIRIPTMKEQREIVGILDSLDNRIELNSQMNRTLEVIGQALFKRWFIDFEFPDESGQPYKSSGGEMIDSEPGEIPKEWKTEPLDRIADFLNGLPMQKYRPSNDEDYLPVIRIRELRQGVTESTDKASMDIPQQYIIKDGDVIFSWSGSLELVVWAGGKGALNQHLFKVTSDSYPKWFYYYWIMHHLEEFRHIAAGKTTTMGHIQRHHLSEALVVIPSQPILDRIAPLMDSILDRMVLNKKESLILSQIRDALLPKLMSGEIRVCMDEREMHS